MGDEQEKARNQNTSRRCHGGSSSRPRLAVEDAGSAYQYRAGQGVDAIGPFQRSVWTDVPDRVGSRRHTGHFGATRGIEPIDDVQKCGSTGQRWTGGNGHVRKGQTASCSVVDGSWSHPVTTGCGTLAACTCRAISTIGSRGSSSVGCACPETLGLPETLVEAEGASSKGLVAEMGRSQSAMTGGFLIERVQGYACAAYAGGACELR